MSVPEHVLVIGTGSIAKRHIANLKQHLGVQCVSCVSASGRSFDAIHVGADRVFGSLEEALQATPDFVVVASPAPWHVEHASVFSCAKVPTLIEKPLAASLADFQDNGALLVDNQDLVQVAYNLRSMAAARKLRTLLAEKVIGRLLHIHIEVGQYLPDWRPQTDYRQNVSGQAKLGGGVLLELSHEIDYLLWLFGDFDTVYCIVANSGQLEIDVEDSADAVFSRADGLVASMRLDFLQRVCSRSCKIIGETGTLVWDLMANTITLERGGADSLVCFSDPKVDRNQMYIDELKAFLDPTASVSENATLEQAANVLAVIEAMRCSAAEGRAVSIQKVAL